jgi:FG-GAP repeat protein/VCBS repeat protein
MRTLCILPTLPAVALILLLGATSSVAQTVGGGFETLLQWDGRTPWEELGHVVVNAKDVNGDGIDDVLVGEPAADPGGLINAGAALIFSGADGTTIWQWNGAATDEKMGHSVGAAGDVNQDGYADLIVGSPGTNSKGAAFVYSGIDGTLLYEWYGEATGDLFGLTVSGAGDVNGDGIDDLIVAAPFAEFGGRRMTGTVYVFSGATGAQLYQWHGVAIFDNFGSAAAAAGDVNLDGYADLVVGADLSDPNNGRDAGSVYVYSGFDGSVLRLWHGANPGDEFGDAVANAGDVNHDGFPDLVVGAYRSAGRRGSVFVYSGLDGTQLHQWEGEASEGSFGRSISSAGDVNNDGFVDVIVGANRADYLNLRDSGLVFVYSGADGRLLHQLHGESPWDNFGKSVAGSFDINGNGLHDLIVAADRTDPGGIIDAGSVYVFEFNPYVLASDEQISISTGGSIDYQLDFPDQTAGYHYKVLTSNSGTGPTLFGIEIPLTEDDLMHRSWMGRYPGAVVGNLQGTLDAEGKATATIRIAAGNWTELIGRNFYLAAVAIPPFGPPEYSSIAVPIKFIP